MAWPAQKDAFDDDDPVLSILMTRPKAGALSDYTSVEVDRKCGEPGAARQTIFQSLLAQLHEEHERQLQKLLEEIRQLSSGVAAPDSPGHAAPVAPVSPAASPRPGLGQTPTQVFDEHMQDQTSLQPVTVEKDNTLEGTRPSTSTASKKHTDSHLLDILRPAERSRWEAFTNGPLDVIVGVCIVLSIAGMFIRSEYYGYTLGVELGYQDPSDWHVPDGLEGYLDVGQYIFSAIFALEMVVRLCVHRSFFFYRARRWQLFNILDMIVVLVMLVDQYILVALEATSDNAASIQFVRVCRLMKVLRTLRALRAIKIFHNLRALVLTVVASLDALFWSMVLLAILMMMGALILCQTLSDRLRDEDISETTRAWLYKMYGTAGRSYYTVFELTFSGGWPNYARTLVEEVHTGYAYFFIVYISLVVFATFRIITAIFLKDTLAAAANDTEMVIAEQMKVKQNYARKLKNFFDAADTSGDGLITFSEFQTSLADPRIKLYLHHMELDTREYEQLFAMMDDGDGYVSTEEFIEGALRTKGVARAQDILAIAHNVKKLTRLVQSTVGRLHVELRAVSRDVAELKVNQI